MSKHRFSSPSTEPPETEPSSETPAAGSDRLSEIRRRGITSLRRHTARGMAINSVFQLGLVGVSALRGLIVAAFITRADYGVWGLIGVTLWTAMGLKIVFGANDKYIQQSEEDQEEAYHRAFTVELIFAAAIAPVAIAFVIGYATLAGRPAVLAPGLALLLLLPATALRFPVVIFYRQMDYRRQRLLDAIDPALGAVVTLALAVAGAGYWSFVAGALAGAWAAAFVALRASPFPLALRYDRGTLGSYLRFSAPLLVSVLSVIGLFQVITVVGVGAIGLAGVGTFTLVGNLVQFTDQADDIITDTLYPAVCAVRDRVDVLSEIFVKSNRLSLMWAVPFGVGLTLFADDLAQYILGPGWRPAIPLLEIMGLVTAVHHVGYNWAAFVKARGKTWPIAIASAAICGVTVAAVIPLMHTYHVEGIGLAFAIGEVVGLAFRAVYLSRFFERLSLLPMLVRGFAPTVIAAAPILLLRHFIGFETTLATAVGMFLLYVTATVAATVALERNLLREAIGYMFGRSKESGSTLMQAT